MAVSGCATVNVANVGQTGYALADDERRMHKRAEEICEIIDESGHVYADANLENYLTALANGLLPDSAKAEHFSVTVKVLTDPTLNAFAFPNGRIYIHAGMLAAIENEAQLAALLAHETTHVLNRHALKQFRSLTNKSAFFATFQVPLAVVGGELGSILAQLSVISSVYGYSQELESEADSGGFAMMTEKGYDVYEAPKLFEHLEEFIKDEDVKEPFFFSTHPGVAARIQNLNHFIEKNHVAAGGGKKVGAEIYQSHARDLVLKDINFCLAQGMFKTAERILDRYVKLYPDNASGYFYKGELYRQRQDKAKGKKERDKSGDYPIAIEAYDQAILHDPALAQAYQAKGRVLQRLQKIDEAKSALRKYLELSPQAEDREYIQQFLSDDKRKDSL